MDGPYARPISMKSLCSAGFDVMESRAGPYKGYNKLVGLVSE
jgi:hypothetical protein